MYCLSLLGLIFGVYVSVLPSNFGKKKVFFFGLLLLYLLLGLREVNPLLNVSYLIVKGYRLDFLFFINLIEKWFKIILFNYFYFFVTIYLFIC